MCKNDIHYRQTYITRRQITTGKHKTWCDKDALNLKKKKRRKVGKNLVQMHLESDKMTN